MKFQTYLLLILIFAFSCRNRADNLNIHAPVENIYFNKYKEVPVKDFLNEVSKNKKYIKLEIGQQNNSIGIISKVSVLKNNFYIMDTRKKLLNIYDQSGKYLGDIFRVRKDYANMDDFDVDSTGTIYVLDGKLDNLLTYDYKLKLQSLKKLPFEADVIQVLKNGSLLLGLSSWNKKANTGDQIILVNKQLKVLDRLLVYSDYVDDNFWLGGYRLLKTNGVIYYNKPIDNNVYTFFEDGKMEKIYHFDFGEMNVPDECKKNILPNIQKFNKYRSLTDFTVINKNFALGSLLDRQKNRLYYLDRSKNEILLEDLNSPIESGHVITYINKHLYTYIMPGEYEKGKFNELPADVQTHLAKGGFVICDYELKQ